MNISARSYPSQKTSRAGLERFRDRRRGPNWRALFARLIAAPLALVLVASFVGVLLQAAVLPASASVPQALIDGATVANGSSSVEAAAATADGFAVTVVSGATWDGMTAAQFAQYQVIIAGDPSCGTIATSFTSNESTWAPVVMGTSVNTAPGNRVLIGTDPVFHYLNGSPGAQVLIADGITYAGALPGRTGVYFDASCGGMFGQNVPAMVTPLSTGTGTWTQDSGPPCGGNVAMVASTPAFSSLTSADLEGWGCSVHSSYPTFTSDWTPLAVATDTTSHPTCGTDNTVSPPQNVCGEAYVLIAGESISLSSADIALSQSVVGSTLTVSATVSNGGTPLSGQHLTFTITGQNAGVTGVCVPATCLSDTNGNVTFAYPDTNGAGTDTVLVSVTVGGSTQQSSTSYAWPSAPAGPTVGTTTTVVSALSPTLAGQPVTFTATVAGSGAGTPGGTVQFGVDGANVGGPVTLTASSAVSDPVTGLAAGPHTVTATYSGDTTFLPSASGLLTQTVNVAHTTTVVTSTANPSVSGQPVTFTATTTPNAPAGGMPGGTMAFFLDGQPLATVVMSGGTASTSIASLSPGHHVITAVYPTTASYISSSGVLAGGQSVNQASSTTTLSSSAPTSAFGQPVAFSATVATVAPGVGVPTGQVTFFIDGTPLAPVALSGGTAVSPAIAGLGLGGHSVTATYSGDTDTTGSSGSLIQNVAAAGSVTTLVPSGSPSVYGQPETFTATVAAAAPGAGSPTGSVTFFADGTSLGTVALSHGDTATSASISTLGAGSHTVTATYTGDATFLASTGSTSQQVDPATTSEALSTSNATSFVGQSVQFTATLSAVAPGNGTPSGSVQFFDNGTARGAPQTLDATGSASLSITSLALGAHAVTATFTPGSANYAGTTATLTGGQNVVRAASTTNLISTASPSSYGQAVQFVASVTATYAGTPSGSIQFAVDGVDLGAPVTLADGVATSAAISSLGAGTHSVTATYSGDGTYLPSTASLAGGQEVDHDGTTTTITAELNPASVTQTVSFDTSVVSLAPGSGIPTGQVQLYVDGSASGSPVTLDATGAATITGIAIATPGPHAVTATYSGDANFATSSSGAVTQTIYGYATTTTVATSLTPSVYGQPVTFTAAIDSGGHGNADGDVQFLIDGIASGDPVALTGGAATSPPVTTLSVGSHTVTADYLGTTDYAASSGGLTDGQGVNQAGTITTAGSSANPAPYGQPVTFTATVVPVAPGGGTVTGDIQFFLDGQPVITVPLSDGSASTSVSGLTLSPHTLQAVYQGDASYIRSAAFVPGGQSVAKIDAAGTVTSPAASPVFGQPVTFTATWAGTQGTPTGTVQFGVDGTNLGGPVALTAGTATSPSWTSVAAGPHTVTATYSGNAIYTSGTASAGLAVGPASVTVSTPASSVTSPVAGQPVTYTVAVAAVTPGAGTPSGQVQFLADGTAFGTAPLSSGVAVSPALATLDATSGTPHIITAAYAGDGNFATGTATAPQAVGQAATTVTVVSSASTAVFGQPVTLTATVAPIAPSTTPVSGQVQFALDGVNVGSPVTVTAGTAVLAAGPLGIGAHSVTATFLGSTNFQTSQGALNGSGQAVQAASTVTTLTSSANPSAVGRTVTFTAVVAPAGQASGTPTGQVQFLVDGTNAGSPVTLTAGSATLAEPSLSVGSHPVTANYLGTTQFIASSATLTGGQTVNSHASSVAVASSPNPGTAGTPVVFTATVGAVAPATGTPTGQVQFLVDGSAVGSPAALTNGVASFTTTLGAGSHTITANYLGDATFGAATGTLPGGETIATPPVVTTPVTTPHVSGAGYWLFGQDGGVFTYGDARFYGSTGSMVLNKPVIAMASTPDGKGYWLFASDGGVFAYGDAGFYGSTASMHLNAPIVAMAATPDGKGYWLFASDGGVFAYGDASFFGSAASLHLTSSIVGMAATPNGQGYWLVGKDGSVYAFGNAASYGSLAGLHINAPVVGMATTPDGHGFWLASSDGGVFGFGDATSYGSAAGSQSGTIVGVAGTPDGLGYWLVGANGVVLTFGDANPLGSMAGQHLNRPMTGITLAL